MKENKKIAMEIKNTLEKKEFEERKKMSLEDKKEIYSHFDEAITIFDRDRTENRELYFDTIERSLETLFNEGVIGIEKISLIRDGLIQDYASFLHIMPSEENPVVGDREQNICRLLARCYTYSKDIRAPAIDSFPFDFKDNELQQEYYANNVPLTFNTNFSERLSTGYYLPGFFNIVCACFENCVVCTTPNTYCDWSILNVQAKWI